MMMIMTLVVVVIGRVVWYVLAMLLLFHNIMRTLTCLVTFIFHIAVYYDSGR